MKVILQVFLIATAVALAYQADLPSCSTLVQFWVGLSEPFVCECIDETGADPVLMDSWLHYAQYPDNCSLKCGARCVYIKLKIFDVHDNLNLTVLKSIVPLPDEIFDPILDKCLPIVGDDHCDRIFKLDQCMLTSIFAAVCPNGTRHEKVEGFPTFPLLD